MSAIARNFGLGVDNVIQFEVVLADGRAVKADACTNEDLFWALRGGGGGRKSYLGDDYTALTVGKTVSSY